MLIVKSGNPLSGKVKISGSKNAALPILWASLLVNGKMTIKNIPKIGDVLTFLEIMWELWAVYSFEWNTLFLDTSNLNKDNLNLEKIKKIRASILLLKSTFISFLTYFYSFPRRL